MATTIVDEDVDQDDVREKEIMAEGLRLCRRAALLWAVLGTPVVALLVMMMRKPIEAANHLLQDGGEVSYEPWMPVVIFAMVGGGYGCLFGWRMIHSTGMTGLLVWRWGIGVALLLTVVTALSGFMVHGQTLPMLFLISSAAMFVSLFVGSSVFTRWSGD